MKPWGIKYDAGIYDLVRLWRISNTINSKSGLYKVPLTADELLGGSVESIKELANTKREGITTIPPERSPELMKLYKNATEEVINAPKINGVPTSIDNEGFSKNTKLCYRNLSNGVDDGERDEAAVRLACYYSKQGFQQDMVVSLLTTWNLKNKPPLSEKVIKDKVLGAFSKTYDYGCNDHILKKYCDKKCYLISKNTVVDSSIIILKRINFTII